MIHNIATILRNNKTILVVILLGFFLRVQDLNSLMQFIPDQGWFYISARDMLLNGAVPLIGPPTSHPWIHHGPLWTYTLALIFALFRFNPIAPAYAIAFLGTFTVWLIYEVGARMFSKRVGLICALLFATSPLIVTNSRIPYHTSPIPFLVLLLFYLTYVWTKGRSFVFPFIAFLLGVLYNHEITTFVFTIAVFIVFAFGFYTKQSWALKTIRAKIILYSLALFLLPMLPFILYDIHHGYKQTVGFVVWVGYRVIKLPLSFFNKSFASSGSNPSTISEFLTYYQELMFVSSKWMATLLLGVSSVGIFYVAKKKISSGLVLTLLFLFVSLGGLFVHRVPIEADTLLISPFFIITTALVIDAFLKSKKYKRYAATALVVIVACNTYTLINSNYFTKPGPYFRIPFYTRLASVRQVIQLADGKAYNIVGKGELSSFPVFLDPYRYLLWYEGYPPATKEVATKIQIWETGGAISITKLK